MKLAPFRAHLKLGEKELDGGSAMFAPPCGKKNWMGERHCAPPCGKKELDGGEVKQELDGVIARVIDGPSPPRRVQNHGGG